MDDAEAVDINCTCFGEITGKNECDVIGDCPSSPVFLLPTSELGTSTACKQPQLQCPSTNLVRGLGGAQVVEHLRKHVEQENLAQKGDRHGHRLRYFPLGIGSSLPRPEDRKFLDKE